MASPAQKYRFAGLSSFSAETIEQLDEMLEDLYTYLTQSPFGVSTDAFNLSEMELEPGLLTVDDDGAVSTLSDDGVVFVDSDGVGQVISPGTEGAFLRQGTINPEWSALVIPNAAAIGDLWYASTTGIISRLADVATGNALISGGVNTAPLYGKIGLTTHVSGILPMANGGTNNGSAFTTGSVIYFDGTRFQQDNAGLFFDAANNRLGVGVASPTETVDVRGATPDIGLRHTSADDYASFRFYEGSTQKAIIQHVGSNFATVGRRDDLELFTLAAGADIVLYVNSVEQARFASLQLTLAGQIKIAGGTPGAGKVLTSDANGLATWETAAGGSPGGSNTHVQFNDSSAFGGDAGLTYNKTTDALVLAGLFDISGAAAGQITFPATQNSSAGANTLDDYKEDSVTITLTFGGGSTGITYDVNSARYVKIGRLVVLAGRIALTSKGSSTGTALVTGLPFTISAGSPFGSGTSVAKFLNMVAINNWFSVLSADGTTTLELWNGGALNTTVLTDANFTNTSDFNFQIAYIASA